jgi:hypothetical protein
MYENYTRQALPSKRYRELLGSALCVFNSNNAFVIENILRSDDNSQYDWYGLMDFESGRLATPIKNTITQKAGEAVANLFDELVIMRNRIIHSFQITSNDEQVLATKTRVKDGNHQFIITETYLLNFIKKNEDLSAALHHFRGF